jgi:ATP-dependent Clp protease ATP-binding subunit ClpA
VGRGSEALETIVSRTNRWRELDPQKLSPEARRLKDGLLARVVGQASAVEELTTIHQIWRSGLSDPNRPIASFLLLGPTGTGKTRMVEALAEILFGERRAMLKVDCAEFSHSHEIARLIGSPPGYLGHRDTPPYLSQENIDRHQTRESPITLLLFDEIEKANDALWMLLLGVLDKGSLTLGTNEQVDLTRCMIFMTSNVGADHFDRLHDAPLGFRGVDSGPPDMSSVQETVIEATRRIFSPEFLNRIDRRIVFNSLGEPEFKRILELELGYVRGRVRKRLDVDLRCTPAARRYLLEKGTNPRYGARPLRGLLESEVLFAVANLIGSGQVREGDAIQIDGRRDGSGLVFRSQRVSFAAVASASSGAQEPATTRGTRDLSPAPAAS